MLPLNNLSIQPQVFYIKEIKLVKKRAFFSLLLHLFPSFSPPSAAKAGSDYANVESLPLTQTRTKRAQNPFVRWIRVDRCEERCRGLSPPLHNCCSLACWNSISRLFSGSNGPTKAPNAFPEKRLFSRHQSVCPCPPVTTLNFGKVSPFSRPAWLEAIVVHADLVPADDSLTQHRNVKTGLTECVCVLVRVCTVTEPEH